MTTHVPVLLNEAIAGLNIKPDGIYADVTYGGGGHTEEILKNTGNGKVVAFDSDPDAIQNAKRHPKLQLIHADFRKIKIRMEDNNIPKLNGLIADLGLSTTLLDSPKRGFSFRSNAPLDMRFNPSSLTTAATILNTSTLQELRNIFTKYGELENPGSLAKTIVAGRKVQAIYTTFQLRDIALKGYRQQNIHQYLSKIFQALRIAVNDELGALKELLLQSAEVIVKGGRLVIISYHSLEDRIVKDFLNTGNFEGEPVKDLYGNSRTPFKPITKKPIIPTDKEISENNRSRSAKLRIAEKK